MGGGDLNLKKSWHPQTMKNQEKVWKAEQARSQEEKRLNELRKEISDEKTREDLRKIGESSGVLARTDSDKKLEWMYKSSTELVNRDEYLLGRTIDKSFETLQAEEKRNEVNSLGVKQPLNHVEHECVPFSIREYRNADTKEQVDLQRKMMEDPLMLIRQREIESRRKILENPVKLKEIHRILKTDRVIGVAKQKGKLKKSKKSKKSKKKHKKRSKSSDSSSSSSSDEGINDKEKDLDAKLARKYKAIKGTVLSGDNGVTSLSLAKLLDAKYDTISKELDKAVKQKAIRQRRSPSGGDSRGHESKISNRETYRSSRRSRSRESSRNRRIHRSRSRSRNYERRRRSRTPKSRSFSHRNEQQNNSSNAAKSSKLTEEEKEARRREMMENAAWRETDRSQAVKRHREAYEHEEKEISTREFDKNFINKEVRKAIDNHTSVESRIRSNLNNIQRSTSSMNANFARK